MRNSFTIWAIRLMLAAFVVGGMQSCGKEDAPEPPQQEEPTTPDNPDTPDDPDTPDPPREPFDPTKPYKPVNKLKQVFKHGYIKSETTTYSPLVQSPVYKKDGFKEYVVDKNNNLVKVYRNGKIYAEFEYGYFTDEMNNVYHVKYTRHIWNDEYGDTEYEYLCRLNENEMIVDQYKPESKIGSVYEYRDNYLVKISSYDVVEEERIFQYDTVIYEWDSHMLKRYVHWYSASQFIVRTFDYMVNNCMVENRGGLFFTYGYIGLDKELYMAALLGLPPRYIPLSYDSSLYSFYINSIKLDINGLPENINYSQKDGKRTDYYNIEYVWQKFN